MHATTAISLLTKVPKICAGEKTASSINGAGETEFPRLKLVASL
jgi:hypothetical protein